MLSEKTSTFPNYAERLYTGDADKFRHCGLEVLAKSGKATPTGAKPRVVGIYLAWHGWDFGWIPFNIVPSYYLRMPKARSGGLSGMAKATKEIFDEIEKHPDSYFTVAMGHSFGARALEATLNVLPQPGETAKYPDAGILQKIRLEQVQLQQSQTKDPRIGRKGERFPVDLVFYAKAATSNAERRHN